MSRTSNICCLTCGEHVWIGQSNFIYTGEPETMKALEEFLYKHMTHSEDEDDTDIDGKPNHHKLVFIYEPGNGLYEDVVDSWNEITPKKLSPLDKYE